MPLGTNSERERDVVRGLPPLLVDTNERGMLYGAICRFAEKEGISITSKFLEGMGDYQVTGGTIEAKSIPDLFQSWYAKHLQRQLENLDANCDRVFLVIHGDLNKYIQEAKSRGGRKSSSTIISEFQGIFARIMADFDCHIYRAKDYIEAAMFIVKLHKKLNVPSSRHGARSVTRVSTNDVRADMLLAVPGFGPELVEKLLDKCGSIEEMIYSESLKMVKGMGEVKRKRLVEVLTSEEPIKIEKTYKRGNKNGTQSRRI